MNIKKILRELITINNNIDEKSVAGLLLIFMSILIVFLQIIYTFYKGQLIEIVPSYMFVTTITGAFGCLGVSGYFNKKDNS